MAKLACLLGYVQPDAPVELALDGDSLHFQVANRYMNGGKSDGWFPNFTRLLKDSYSHSAAADRHEFVDAIGTKSKRVLLRVRTGAIDFAPLSGGLQRTAMLPEYQGETVDFNFNTRHLLDALRIIPTEQAAILFDESRHAELRPVEPSDGLERRFVITSMPAQSGSD